MKWWVIKYTPLIAGSSVLLYLPQGSVVEGERGGEYSQVSFITRNKNYSGTVYSNYLEELTYEFPENTVFSWSQTPYPYDAAQYILWKNNVQFNLCGEASICYIFGDTIENMLTKWEAKPVSVFQRIFHGGKANTTGINDLKDMVAIYGGETELLSNLLKDKSVPILSPRRLQSVVNKWRIVIACRISGATGELRASGIPHWVVLDKVIPDGINRGFVEIWNPFSGRGERYGWREFSESVYPPYGLAIKPTQNIFP